MHRWLRCKNRRIAGSLLVVSIQAFVVATFGFVAFTRCSCSVAKWNVLRQLVEFFRPWRSHRVCVYTHTLTRAHTRTHTHTHTHIHTHMCLRTKFSMPISSVSCVIAIKPKPKETLSVTAIFVFYVLEKSNIIYHKSFLDSRSSLQHHKLVCPICCQLWV